ncbi:hypothetical protein QBC44DRAFT_98410 [Cladorrhinum sp. PSN332]|nr:hypothetical protein QBC44DRAFT_98410 [Cladorrhinum sp. PSN332]
MNLNKPETQFIAQIQISAVFLTDIRSPTGKQLLILFPPRPSTSIKSSSISADSTVPASQMASPALSLESLPTELLVNIFEHFAPVLPPVKDHRSTGLQFSPIIYGLLSDSIHDWEIGLRGPELLDDPRQLREHAEMLQQSRNLRRMRRLQRGLLTERGRPPLPLWLEEPRISMSMHLELAKTLSRLCLTSKRLCTISQELLYQRVVVHDSKCLLLFWRTMKQNPDLGNFIKELAIWVALSHPGIAKRMARVAAHTLPLTQHPHDRVLYEELKDCLRDELPARAVSEILRRAPHLVKLSLEVPAASDDNSPYSALVRCWGTKEEDGLSGPSKELETLELCHHPSPFRSYERQLYNSFDPLDYWQLLNIPSLSRLCFWKDFLGISGNWDPNSHSQLTNILELRFDSASCGPKDISELIKLLPRLQVLSVEQLSSVVSGPSPWLEPAASLLNIALHSRAETLRHLHLDVRLKHLVGYAKDRSLLPELRNGLSSFPQLYQLKVLKVQVVLLLGLNYPVDIQSDMINLEEKLPASLVELELYENGMEALGSRALKVFPAYAKGVVNLLSRFCYAISAKRFPALRSVRYILEDQFLEYSVRWEITGLLDQLQAPFSRLGVEFDTKRNTRDEGIKN